MIFYHHVVILFFDILPQSLEASADVSKELVEETDNLVRNFKNLKEENLSLEIKVCLQRLK